MYEINIAQTIPPTPISPEIIPPNEKPPEIIPSENDPIPEIPPQPMQPERIPPIRHPEGAVHQNKTCIPPRLSSRFFCWKLFKSDTLIFQMSTLDFTIDKAVEYFS